MNLDNTTGILTIDEFDLHNILIGMKDSLIPDEAKKSMDETTILDYIEIVPKEPDKFDKKLIARWERKMEGLIIIMGDMDAQFHDDAEYTC